MAAIEATKKATAEDQHFFHYQRLDTGKQQFRLLRLVQGGSEDNRYEYELHAFNIEEAPEYTALSYTWGAPTPLREIRVNGFPFLVRLNLHNFLQCYHKLDYIWIDQICIDQQRDDEKNHQVSMMAQIYQRSRWLVVWIGNGSLEFKESVERYHIAKKQDEEAEPDNLQQSESRVDGLDEIDSWLMEDNVTGETYRRRKVLHAKPELCHSYLKAIYGDVYFTRLWIVQEMMLSSYIIVMYQGTTRAWHTSWQELSRLERTFEVAQEQSLALIDLQQARFTHSRVRGAPVDEVRLMDCLERFSNHCCENARDKIYGLLGFVSVKDRIPVDYRKPVEEVYVDVLRHLHKNTFSMKDWVRDTRILRSLAKGMCLQQFDQGLQGLRWLLLAVYSGLADSVQDIGLCVSVFPSELPSEGYRCVPGYGKINRELASTGQKVNAWWYEIDGQKIYYLCQGGICSDISDIHVFRPTRNANRLLSRIPADQPQMVSESLERLPRRKLGRDIKRFFTLDYYKGILVNAKRSIRRMGLK